MSEMSKVEEVARAIYGELASKNVGAGDNLRNVYVADQIDVVALAVAAIEAMREVPKSYLTTPVSKFIRMKDGSISGWYPPQDIRAAIYQEVIDAALKE